MSDDLPERPGNAFIWGLIWSAISIAGPAALFSLGVYPTVMIGAILGAVIRVGTDMAMLYHGNLSRSSPLTVVLVLIQFGALFVASGAALLGSPLGAGAAGIILLTYLVGTVLSTYFSETTDNESEWKYDVDDV
jgi:hypothetical protein